jgi:hypothetical protein
MARARPEFRLTGKSMAQTFVPSDYAFNYLRKAYNQPFVIVGTYWLEMPDGCCTYKTV